MTGAERDAWELEQINARDAAMAAKGEIDVRVLLSNLRARTVARCMCDADGNLMVTTKEQVEALGGKSAAALDRVFAVAQELSGITDEDEEELLGN